jgi:hypothetical protein
MLKTPSHWSRRPAAVFAQSAIAWAIASIANPHLNDVIVVEFHCFDAETG